MAFPQKKPGLGIMIAVGKPKGDDLPAPDPVEGKPKMPPQRGDEPGSAAAPGKIGPEDVDYSEDDLCGMCAYMGAQGTCQKYGFPVTQNGHCEAGFEARDDAGMDNEQDQDGGEMGGGSDQIGGSPYRG